MASWPGRLSMVSQRRSHKNPVEDQLEKLDMPRRHNPVFVDAKAMKEKLRENMHKPRYDVTNFYKKEGIFQEVARDSRFENITLGIISFNALWIAIDCDANDAEVLHKAHPIFILAENFFCLFFTFELVMRFGAFEDKKNCLRDAWFCFDSFMVIMMILETWVMTIVLLAVGGGSANMGNAGMLRLLRLMRLSRMARMARLLRAMPELLILIKGMVAALRSVFFTLLLLALLLYIYAILFRQLTADSSLGEEYFPSIIKSMNRLVLDGIIFDSAGDLLSAMMDEDHYVLICCFYLFVLLAALTVMNMLIGVLCEVVSAVADTEHEQLTISFVQDKLQEIVNNCCEFDEGEEIKINKAEFLNILEYPDSAGLLNEVQVNVFGLVDLVDTIFASESGKEKVLDFGDLVETMLDQRETNTATVKDVTELRKYVRGRIDMLETMMEAHMISLGRLMEKTNGLPPGTWRAELNKVRRELDLEGDQQSPGRPKPRKSNGSAAKPPPQVPPQLAVLPEKEGISDVSTEGTTDSQGTGVVVGRAVDPPAEKSPATKAWGRNKAQNNTGTTGSVERLTQSQGVNLFSNQAQSPEESSMPPRSTTLSVSGSGTPTAKKRFQKKQKAMDNEKVPRKFDEKTPLADGDASMNF